MTKQDYNGVWGNGGTIPPPIHNIGIRQASCRFNAPGHETASKQMLGQNSDRII